MIYHFNMKHTRNYREEVIEYLRNNAGATRLEVIEGVSKAPHGYLWEENYSQKAAYRVDKMLVDGEIERQGTSLYLCGALAK